PARLWRNVLRPRLLGPRRGCTGRRPPLGASGRDTHRTSGTTRGIRWSRANQCPIAGLPGCRRRHRRDSAGHGRRSCRPRRPRMCRRDLPALFAYAGDRLMKPVNTQCRLAARPTGLPKATAFTIVDEPVPAAADGEFVVEIDYLSIDPAMRTWMNAGRSYVPPVEIGEVMRALGVGHVIESRHHEYGIGDVVSGTFGVQNFAPSTGAGVSRIDTSLAPATVHLGALGISGLTAYFGLLDIGRPEPGQTVLVSGAAGSVGSVAGQIARIKGCRAIGIAGGQEKCRWLVEELGFDAAI